MPLPRRQFLWWSAVHGRETAARLLWPAAARPVGVGFIGLGSRGARTLARCRATSGAEVVAVCDHDAGVLQRVAGSGDGWSAEPLLTGDPHQLLRLPAVEAVVLGARTGDQLALAAAACEEGKDVFLLRPAALDGAALRNLAGLAERHRLQVHFARASRFVLDRKLTGTAVIPSRLGTASALVQTRLQMPLPPSPGDLLHELIDEADLAAAVLGGEVVRSLAAGGTGGAPGRWCERRVHLELAGASGPRRALTLVLTAERGPAAAKTSQILLRGSRGAARLTAMPVAGCDPADLRAFVEAVRRREPGPGLTMPRLLRLTEAVLPMLQHSAG
jgi:hypothetical protein